MTGNALTRCLWFNTEAEVAASFYPGIFKDARLGRGTVVPARFFEMIADPDTGEAARGTQAMLGMTRFDIAAPG